MIECTIEDRAGCVRVCCDAAAAIAYLNGCELLDGCRCPLWSTKRRSDSLLDPLLFALTKLGDWPGCDLLFLRFLLIEHHHVGLRKMIADQDANDEYENESDDEGEFAFSGHDRFLAAERKYGHQI